MYDALRAILRGDESAVGQNSLRVAAVVGRIYSIEAMSHDSTRRHSGGKSGTVGADVYAICKTAHHDQIIDRPSKVFDKPSREIGSIRCTVPRAHNRHHTACIQCPGVANGIEHGRCIVAEGETLRIRAVGAEERGNVVSVNKNLLFTRNLESLRPTLFAEKIRTYACDCTQGRGRHCKKIDGRDTPIDEFRRCRGCDIAV